jgi:hypothetical protein
LTVLPAWNVVQKFDNVNPTRARLSLKDSRAKEGIKMYRSHCVRSRWTVTRRRRRLAFHAALVADGSRYLRGAGTLAWFGVNASFLCVSQ